MYGLRRLSRVEVLFTLRHSVCFPRPINLFPDHEFYGTHYIYNNSFIFYTSPIQEGMRLPDYPRTLK